MSKLLLIRPNNNNSQFNNARNMLVASAKKHVKNNGMKSNILSVLSKNNYTQYMNQNKGVQSKSSRLIKLFAKNTDIKTEKKTQQEITTPVEQVNKIDIFSTPATASLTNEIGNALNACGIAVNIFIRNINNADIAVCKRDDGRYLFIFSPQMFLQARNSASYPPGMSPLPENKYFLYQLADLSRKNIRNCNPHILALIRNAKHTFDCFQANLNYYPKECIGKVSVLGHENTIEIMNRTLTIKMLYPALFHKYVLGLRKPDENTISQNYSVIKEIPILRKNICHIHCFYLKFLSSMFSSYITLINNTFDIIVTYTHLDETTLNTYNNNITFLRVNNYGMDIGPKFAVYNYLLNKSINYNYIFYIHSKSDSVKRSKYLMPFITNMGAIDLKLNENNKDNTVGCYFNNIIQYGDGINDNKWSKYNTCYMADILNYLQVKQFKNDKMFEEGNFYILHKRIIDKLFSDKLLYNILNTGNSFDYNWVKCFYKLNNNTIHEVYNKYTQNRLFGNNTPTNKGHDGLADAMIEHVFERLPITLCKEYGIKYNILS